MKKHTTVMLKTKKAQLTICALFALAFVNPAQAQNTSYNANSVPINGLRNCGIGSGVLSATVTGGNDNAGVGYHALYSNTTGGYNAAMGSYALQSNTTGRYNAAFGYQALNASNANNNSAFGFRSLYNNSTGVNNTAVGFGTLSSNTTDVNNVAIGNEALTANTISNGSVAVGAFSLHANTSGGDNTATGYGTLRANTVGNGNTAMGFHTLRSNTTGSDNSGISPYALENNTTGSNNVANGYNALISNTTGSNNTGLGHLSNVSAGTLTNATALGNSAIVNASNKVRIGNTSVTRIEGQVAYSYTSDGRFKTNIKEEDVKGLEFIKKLRPVVYNLDTRKLTEFQTKNMPDDLRQQYLAQDFTTSTKIRQSGFIAQEVEKAAKEVQYDFNGVNVPANPEEENYSIAYSEFVVPLVKAVQEQQKIIETLQQQVNDLLENQKSPTSLDQTSVVGASMEQNVPNPFSQETVIKFNLSQQVSNAAMNVYDLSGKQLKSLPINQRGSASLTITADQLAAGMYIYSIVADGKILSSKRMVVAGK